MMKILNLNEGQKIGIKEEYQGIDGTNKKIRQSAEQMAKCSI